MFVIVLNSSNVVNSDNNTLVYNFPNSLLFQDKYVAVSQVNMYYSWFNIKSSYSNNKFSYTWTNGGVITTYDVVIPDGLYEVKDLNNYLQFVMEENKTYLINASGDYVYYAEFLVNPNRYAIQINTYLVPTSLPTGYTQPSGFAGFPTQACNPIITIPASFSAILGYNPVNNVIFSSNNNVDNLYTPPSPNADNYYVDKLSDGTLSYLSNTYPNIQPNSSIYLSISNINNPYAQPSSILYAISPNVAIGEQITETPPNFMWNKMIDGTYNQLRVQFLGIDKQPITIKDPNMTIVLTIRDKNDIVF